MFVVLISGGLTVIVVAFYLAYRRGLGEHPEQPPPDQVMKRIKHSAWTWAYRLYSRTQLGRKMFEREMRQAAVDFPDGHTALRTFTYGDLRIVPIPFGSSNYTYLIMNESCNEAIAVDLGDCSKVKQVCDEHNVNLVMVLTTHKHWDHSSANAHAQSTFGDSLRIVGGEIDRPSGCTETVGGGDFINLGPFNIRCILTPGHTNGHIVYLLAGDTHNTVDCLFTGDLLFLGGCGRNFEGTCAQLQASLDTVMLSSDDTLIWPGHEYAALNLAFAMAVEPNNTAVADKEHWVRVQREERFPTCPSTIGEERTYNPFVRTHAQDVLAWCQLLADDDGEEDREPDTSHHLYAHDNPNHQQSRRLRAFTKLRNAKNSFKS